MCYCNKLKRLYIIGKYIQNNERNSLKCLKSDFYYFDLEKNEWNLISDDTNVF
jgi:hypothetical protein